MEAPDDGQLVNEAIEGDRRAYGRLVQRHERSVLAVARSILRHYHDAEDAAQEAFVIAHAKLNSLRDRNRFGPWIIRIAHRQALRAARRSNRLRIVEQTVAVPATTGNHTLDGPNQRLLDAVMRLPRHERDVVLLRHMSDLTTKQIADAVGRPPGTVTKQLSRAHARLKRWLSEPTP